MDHSLNISDVEIYQYALDLRRPFAVAGDAVGKREGLIMRIVLADGRSAEGEIAPLPGVSPETLKKALFQLKEYRPVLLSASGLTGIPQMRILLSHEDFLKNCASVKFGIESALFNCLSVASGQSVTALLHGKEKDIPVAGLLRGTPEEIAARVRTLLNSGCRVFKLKVGSPNIPLDVKKFQTVCGLIAPSGKVRLDANRSWGLKEAVAFAKSVNKENIAFIEEPVKDPRDLAAFISETGFDVALDETLWDFRQKNIWVLPGVKVWVIKPTMIGGIFRALDFICSAHDNQKDCVISSSFESGVGSRMLAHLASLTTLDTGLGPCDWFKEDLLPPLRAENSCMIPSKNKHFQWSDINRSFLTRLNV